MAMEKTVDSYPTRESIDQEDYVVVGKYGTTYKMSVSNLKANLHKGMLNMDFGIERAEMPLMIDDDGNVFPAEIAAVTIQYLDENDNVVGEIIYPLYERQNYNFIPPPVYGFSDSGYFEYEAIGSISGVAPEANTKKTQTIKTKKTELIPVLITIDKPPKITTYKDGDAIDYTGMVVSLQFSNNKTRTEIWNDTISKKDEVRNKFTLLTKFADYNAEEYPTNMTTQEIPVSYDDPVSKQTFTASFEINVSYNSDIAKRIEVTTPPTKTQYIDGETIDYTGMVVTAYNAAGESLGDVPYEELTFQVERADMDKVSNATSTSALVKYAVPCGRSLYFKTSATTTLTGSLTVHEYYSGCVHAVHIDGDVRYERIDASANPSDVVTHRSVSIIDKNGEVYSDSTSTLALNDSYTYDGKTVYFRKTRVIAGSTKTDWSLQSAPEANEKVAWTIVYGDLTSLEPLPVQWKRPGDGAVLETEFEIAVATME